MKKVLLSLLLITSLCSSCIKENKYQVKTGFFTYEHFDTKVYTNAIKEHLGDSCKIQVINAPTGYHINHARVLHYEVIYEKNEKTYIIDLALGYVLTEEEIKEPNFIQLNK